MTRRTIPMTVPMGRAAGVLPRRLEVGSASLEIDHEGSTINTGLGRGVRYDARWMRGTLSGAAHVDIVQTSKLSAEITVSLAAPRGLARVLWTQPRLRGIAELFAHGLRYQIETRASEEADGFDVRRTSTDLVKARSF